MFLPRLGFFAVAFADDIRWVSQEREWRREENRLQGRADGDLFCGVVWIRVTSATLSSLSRLVVGGIHITPIVYSVLKCKSRVEVA